MTGLTPQVESGGGKVYAPYLTPTPRKDRNVVSHKHSANT